MQYTVSYKTVKVNGVRKTTAKVYIHGFRTLTLTHPEEDKLKPFVKNYMTIILNLSDKSQLAR